MPRIRTVKPEFFDDEKLGTVSRDARLIFIGLLIFADDYGVVKGNSRWLKARIFPCQLPRPEGRSLPQGRLG